MTTHWQEATSLDSIWAAIKRAARGKREQPAIARFLMDGESEGLRLQRELRAPMSAAESWWPGKTKSFWIRDPKPRWITVSPFRDRVVHHVLCGAMEPWLERYSVEHSYACWKGRGQHKALLKCQQFSRQASWALKADISEFFASVPHGLLLAHLKRRVPHKDLRLWVERALVGGSPGAPARPGRGLPIGALTSQHLANLYLGLVDHWVTDGLGFGKYLRYMDDFVVFGERESLQTLRKRLGSYLQERLDLHLNERRTKVQPVRDGIPFLGFRVFPRRILLQAERWKRFRDRHMRQENLFFRGQIEEDQLASSLDSQFAHLTAFDTLAARRVHLRRLAERKGRGLHCLQPGDSWRFLEERTAQRAGGEPQQEAAFQPQRQPGLSCGELNTQEVCLTAGQPSGTVGGSSRSASQFPGIDPLPVLCSRSTADTSASGTESQPPGGGTFTVAARPFLDGET